MISYRRRKKKKKKKEEKESYKIALKLTEKGNWIRKLSKSINN